MNRNPRFTHVLSALPAVLLGVSAHAATPLLYYSFDEPTDLGNNVTNLGSGGGAYDGSYVDPFVDAVGYDTVNPAPLGSGGQFINFSGDATGGGQAAHINTNQQVSSILNANGSYTLGAWVRIDALTTGNNNDGLIFGGDNGATLHNGVRGSSFQTGHWGNDHQAGTINPAGTAAGRNTANIGEWNHVVWQYDADQSTGGNTQRVYLNGQDITNNMQYRGAINNPNNFLVIGAARTATGDDRDFEGALDDVVIYNESLTYDQIGYLAAGNDPLATPTPTVIATTTINSIDVINGWTMTQSIPGGNGTIGSLLDAINATTTGSSVTEAQLFGVVNWSDNTAGTTGNFSGDDNYQDASNGFANGDNFGLGGTSQIRVYDSGYYTFGATSDDGHAFFIDLDGDGTLTQFESVLWNDYNHGTQENFDSVYLEAGTYDVAFIGQEAGGGANFELFWAPGLHNDFNDQFTLLAIPEPSRAILLSLGLGALFLRRRK